jgi:hypothetical protein
MNEETIDIIITNLKVISQLKLNEKLCIRKGHLFIDSSSNYQFLKRWFNRDSRDIVLIYIRNLVRNIAVLFEKMKEYTESDSKWILTRILTELENSDQGLVNLKRTYDPDPYMVATLENIMFKFKELTCIGRTMLIQNI